MAKLFILVLVTLALAVSHAAIPEHLITSLPGYNGSFPSKQYSGYINVDATNGRYLHYWFVESESQPASDPVVLWMNGGPGCSSLDGYFYEHGPLHFQDDQLSADGVPALKLNPDRWNKIANVIFLEAPAGVGFSYSETPGDYNTNDNKTAADNFAFLQGFFKAYPEFAQNRFFVSGESYAGIYVPTLVEQIMIHNDKGDSNINLEGFLVGNGCIGNAVGACGADGTRIAVDFLYGHALYSTDLHKQILANCPDLTNPSDACSSLLDQMSNDVGNVNVYNIYADCISGGLRKAHRMGWTNATTTDVVMNSRDRRIPSRPVDELVGGPVGCIDGISAGAYLNNDAVRAAIHVLPMSQLPSWSICSSSIGYSSTIDSLLGLYPTLIKRYRVLIYNGDVDACVPYLQDEEWTSSLGYSVVAPWHPWSLNNQVAGYATIFSENNFTFITVKGSGHMVPQYRPPQAFEMLNRFLNKQPF